MKALIISMILFISTATVYQTQAQVKLKVATEKENKLATLESQRQEVEADEKALLKEDVEVINQQLEVGEITAEEAEILKTEAAEKRALNIENRLNIIDQQIALINRNPTDYERKIMELGYISPSKNKTPKDSVQRRTSSNLILAFGLNNTLIDGQSLDDSPYKIGGSRFFEIGFEFSTVLMKNGAARLNYGLSFQFNGIKTVGNMYFVEEGKQTVLEEYPHPLKKAKLRIDNLVIPVHLELGPAKDNYYHNRFKVGLGGYLGVSLNTIQKLKYKENGESKKSKISDNYNTNNFIYGLSSYIGYGQFSLYVKYDLNSVFKDNPIEQHNVSAGIRMSL